MGNADGEEKVPNYLPADLGAERLIK